jgi:hypothetical protein
VRSAAIAIAAALGIAGCHGDAPPPPGKLELIEAPAGADVATLIAAEVARAAHDRRQLVVYVGAPWCEPCERFHAAAAAGRLDAMFPSLRLVVFDADRDDAGLTGAGYGSKMIPLFAVPGPDGHAGPRRIEGGIKGDGAVDNLSLRLHDLLVR